MPDTTADIEEMYAAACAKSSDINELLPTLRAYSEQCRHVTEFGMRSGVSTTAFLAARPARLVSYDIEANPPALEQLAAAARETGVDFRFLERNVQRIQIEPTDLLFIDTWHVFEQLLLELALHSWRVRRFILVHDTTTYGEKGEIRHPDYRNRTGPPRRGLWPAIELFLRLNRRWKLRERLTYNNGLTVLERIR